MTVFVLGNQLLRTGGPLASDPDDRVLFVEAREFARRHPYHPHKLTLVFSAMRHLRDELRAAGREVAYHRVETFAEGLDAHFESHPGDDLVVMRPPSHGAQSRLRDLVEERGGTLTVVRNESFLIDPETFDEWAGEGTSLRHENFYRFVRRETGYLMDDGDPVGGEWNYDDQNRESAPADYDPPDPPTFEPDAVTREVRDWVTDEFDGGYHEPPFGGGWADPEPFGWPVTREQALVALDAFLDDRLAAFGPYQDAMVDGEWAMHHSLLSAALNLGLLEPTELVEGAISRWRDDSDVPLQSVEGFVRQILGWREFVRHVYRREMPGLATANQLEATRDLPAFYWTGETEMACLHDAIRGVRERGYSHHIQRLMILSNFALVYGVEPAALNRWFHAGYVDAYHWVTTPNVVGMGTFGSDALSTKPYAASANYVTRMSDYCGGCPYDPDATTGENACPFNALYWDFLGRNEERLRSNHRMGLVYSHWDRRDEDAREVIYERADEIRSRAERGEL